MTVKNIYEKSIDTSADQRHLKKKPRISSARAFKDAKKVIEAPVPIVDSAAVDKTDSKLLEILKDYLIDLLEHSYEPLIEQIFDTIVPSKVEVEEDDAFHLFRVQAFAVEAVKIQAKM